MPTLATGALAAELGISRQRLCELGRKGKIKREPNGEWDPKKVRAALSRNLDTLQASQARGEERPGPAPAIRINLPEAPIKGTLAHAQLMHEQAKAARSALEAQRLEGKLIDRKTVEAEWVDVCGNIRDGVLGLPMRCCNRLPAEWRRQLAAVLEDECRKVLNSLADEIRTGTRAA